MEAMLEGNAVGILVGKLREGGGDDSEAAGENCLAVLLTLCQGNMRFRGWRVRWELRKC